MLVAETMSPLIAVVLGLVGSGGLLGIVVALVKLPTERSSMAITQAQGANETLVELNQVLRETVKRANERTDAHRDRADAAELHCQMLEREIERLEAIIAATSKQPI